jgi:predicted XRE-type DNA-binding protein
MKKSGQVVSGSEVFDDVWEALEPTPQAAANMRVRAALMTEITRIVEENKWTQAEAAKRCGVTQPRINELLRGHIHRFSVDALLKMTANLGRKIRVHFEAA